MLDFDTRFKVCDVYFSKLATPVPLLRMPCGLRNASMTFQRVMDIIAGACSLLTSIADPDPGFGAPDPKPILLIA
jgi:hypothetical protein